MTKADLIDEISKISSLTKKETETIVNTIFDNITDALSKGDKVELRGFGSFRIRHRNSRKGRNPKTGSSVDVPQKRVPFFKVGKRLRELVNARGGLGVLCCGAPMFRGHTRQREAPLGPVADGLDRRREASGELYLL